MPDDTCALRFPYVLFDLGSTLIYFEGDWPTVMAQALQTSTEYLRSLGYNLDAKTFPLAYFTLIQDYYRKRNDKFIEYTSDQVLKEALRSSSYPQPPPEHLRQSLKIMYGVLQNHWFVEKDAVSTLETLRTRGHHLGIVSNAADDEDVQTLVDNAHLRPYFDFILTSAVAGVRKPSPKIFENALAGWNARPDQAVMVGDTVTADIAGANQLGIASVWIMRRADTPENRTFAKMYPPRATIYALSELPGLLEHWPET